MHLGNVIHGNDPLLLRSVLDFKAPVPRLNAKSINAASRSENLIAEHNADAIGA
jgi:hypothetical protein